MARRRAQFYMYGRDSKCAEIIKFIEESGVMLDIRDIEKLPLSADELTKLIGYCDIYHFLNPLSKAYDKHGFDKKDKDRKEVMNLMAADPSLVKCPIVRTSRLTTLGCDKKTVGEVLLLSNEGKRIPEEVERVKAKSKGGKQHRSSRSSVSSGR